MCFFQRLEVLRYQVSCCLLTPLSFGGFGRARIKLPENRTCSFNSYYYIILTAFFQALLPKILLLFVKKHFKIFFCEHRKLKFNSQTFGILYKVFSYFAQKTKKIKKMFQNHLQSVQFYVIISFAWML